MLSIMKRMKISPIQKLERALMADYDIAIPYEVGDPWIILDPDDDEVSEGETLEEAIEKLQGNFDD